MSDKIRQLPKSAGKGFRFLENGELIIKGDQPFDIYSGWLGSGFSSYHAKNKHHFHNYKASMGRWIGWRRKI